MKWHIDQYHTENHLKPHICPVCQKGFATRQHFDDHMNIHTGNKPYVCKYCGRGFADRGNHRMHERTAHEGHKRQKWIMPQNDNTYTFKRPNSSIPDLYLNSTEFSTKYCIENVNRL